MRIRKTTRYEVGRRLEWRVRNVLRNRGYCVIRAAQSKPIDLVALRDGQTILIECKTERSSLSRRRIKELLDLANQAGSMLILARRNGRKLAFTDLRTAKPFEPA